MIWLVLILWLSLGKWVKLFLSISLGWISLELLRNLLLLLILIIRVSSSSYLFVLVDFGLVLLPDFVKTFFQLSLLI